MTYSISFAAHEIFGNQKENANIEKKLNQLKLISKILFVDQQKVISITYSINISYLSVLEARNYVENT